jgi:SAM-dependent methyltransferase
MSTTLGTPPDLAAEHDVEAVADRILTEAVTFSEYLSVWLGRELGLYAAMWQAGPTTAHDLATHTGITPRYATEWLEQQTVAGYLDCVDAGASSHERAFALPDAVAAVLIDAESGAYLGPLLDMARGVASVLEPLVAAYRSGGGVPYAHYGDGIRHGIGRLNGPTFDHQLPAWLQQLPDLDHRLRTAAAPRILDLGCGIGRSAIALARSYPRATVRGIDLDPASIAEAREAAAAAGLAHRVTFACADAAELTEDTRYDLVTIFEALHDMGDPVGALRAARSSLAEGGSVYVADEKVSDEFSAEADLVERLQYGFSVLHCLPATLAEDPVVANGTVLRMPTLVGWAHAAGFGHVEDLEVDDLFWRHYRLDVEARG